MDPNQNSPIIYPIELGHEMVVEERKGEWINVKDKITGLKGWVFSENFSEENPSNSKNDNIYNDSFEIFKLEPVALASYTLLAFTPNLPATSSSVS